MKTGSYIFRSLSLVFVLCALLVFGMALPGCGDSNSNEEEVTSADLAYPIVDRNQGLCYDNSELIDCPAKDEAFYGQDAQYTGTTPSYTDNGDSTITDNVTGLIWTQNLSGSSMPWANAAGYCESLTTGGYSDWRLPTVKELWSIRDFSQGWPWVDTDYFYLVGDGSDQRQHHSWTSNLYLVESEYQNEQVQGDPAFIVNDWTGHIKAMSGSRFVRAVRGNTSYGINDFVVNGDGTVSDNATGLMWSQDDNGEAINWEAALAYAEAATTAGYDDWRLPNAKELQSIADYSGVFPAMNTSVFNLTKLTNIMGQTDYPFYWSSTSNPVEGSDGEVDSGSVYAWVLAAGYNTDPDGYDLHGAGSIVFTPKSEENFTEMDPEIHRYNYVRLVRGGDVTETPDGDPSMVDPDRVTVFEDGDTGGPGGRPEGDGTPPEGGDAPDLAAAAAILGVTEAELMDALGDPAQGQPDFAAAAAQLGVTEQELMDALTASSGGSGDDGAGDHAEGDAFDLSAAGASEADGSTLTGSQAYTIVDTGQSDCYNSNGKAIVCPAEGNALYGQDAQYNGAQFAFQDNGDGTVTDLNTGLMWQAAPSSQSFSWQEAVDYAEDLTLGGYDDWRVPSTKELFSISDFSEGWPYLDTGTFDLAGRSVSKDEQYWASYYVGLTHGGAPSAFGVNHATGHIKAYPAQVSGPMGNYVRVVRGEFYGLNDFVDNEDGTVTDLATGLMWQQADSGSGMDWEEALAYAEGMEWAGYDDWHLPSVKELQSIVDYSKSPNAISSEDVGPAIDTDYFDITALPTGTTAYNVDYGYFWTSTSAYFSPQSPGYDYAWYVAFGTAVGPDGEDTHGAGGVRFDTKVEGGPAGEGDERIYNYVRLVRDID